MKISLRRRHALTVADGAFSHKVDHVTIFKEILNPDGHPNRITGSKVTAILLKGWSFPIGGGSSLHVGARILKLNFVKICLINFFCFFYLMGKYHFPLNVREL